MAEESQSWCKKKWACLLIRGPRCLVKSVYLVMLGGYVAPRAKPLPAPGSSSRRGITKGTATIWKLQNLASVSMFLFWVFLLYMGMLFSDTK